MRQEAAECLLPWEQQLAFHRRKRLPVWEEATGILDSEPNSQTVLGQHNRKNMCICVCVSLLSKDMDRKISQKHFIFLEHPVKSDLVYLHKDRHVTPILTQSRISFAMQNTQALLNIFCLFSSDCNSNIYFVEHLEKQRKNDKKSKPPKAITFRENAC